MTRKVLQLFRKKMTPLSRFCGYLIQNLEINGSGFLEKLTNT